MKQKGVILISDNKMTYFAGIACPKCELIDIDGNDIYDPLAGAWVCPRCHEIIIWANSQMITHFGNIRRKIGWGKFWNVDSLLREQKERHEKISTS